MVTEIAGQSEGESPLQRSASSLRALMPRFDICSWIVLFGLSIDVLGIVFQLRVLHRFQELLDIYGYGHVPRDQVPDGKLVDALTRISGLLGVAIFLTAFFVAMGRARRIAVEAGITGYENSFAWTVGSLFVPFANLYSPWVGLAEIRKSVLVSVERDTLGDAWSAFKGISFATLAIAILLIGGNLGELAYDIATRLPVGHGATEYANWLTTMTAAR